MYGFGGGMGGFGGGQPGGFNQAVDNHFSTMMGQGFNPSPGGMPQPNYGQAAQGMSNQMGGYGQMGQNLSAQMGGGYGGMAYPGGSPDFYANRPSYPGIEQMLRQGQMPGYGGGFSGAATQVAGQYLRNQFDNGMAGGNMGGATPWGRPMPNPGMNYGGNPQPGGMPATNPDMGGRQFANGDPYHNAKGNLRMRYR